MAEVLFMQHQAPAWLDGSPGGPVRLWCDVDNRDRVTGIRLDIAVGVVGRITVTVRWDGVEFVYTAPNLTTPDGYTETRNVPNGARVVWVVDQLLGDGGTYTGPSRDGIVPSVEVGWVNPDGVMTTEQRAEHERGRGGG